MIWWSKITAWIKAHWNWLALLALAGVAYFLGRKDSANLLAHATIAKDQYKKDAEAIEKAAKDKTKRDDKIDNRKEEIKKALIEEKERKLRLVTQEEIDADEVFVNMGIKKK